MQGLLDIQHSHLDDVFSKLERMSAGDVRGVVCLGRPGEAVARIAAAIPQAIRIWNIHTSYGESDVFRYSESENKLIIKSIKEFFSTEMLRG